MHVVLSEAERLEALVRDFLSFARPASPAMTPLDGTQAVSETVELFRPQAAARGIDLELHVDGPLPVRADPRQLRRRGHPRRAGDGGLPPQDTRGSDVHRALD